MNGRDDLWQAWQLVLANLLSQSPSKLEDENILMTSRKTKNKTLLKIKKKLYCKDKTQRVEKTVTAQNWP